MKEIAYEVGVFKAIIILGASLLSSLGWAYELDGDFVNKNFIEQVFKEVIEDLNANEEVISRYFSPSYIQHVDGHTLNYKEFVQHMMVQKTLLDSVKVTIERSVFEDGKFCTVHRVDAIKKNGTRISIQVIAYFEVENNKIVLCDELTYLLKGASEDANIGSVK